MELAARWPWAVEVRSVPRACDGVHPSRERAVADPLSRQRRAPPGAGRDKAGTRLHGSLCVEDEVIPTLVSFLHFHVDKHLISY